MGEHEHKEIASGVIAAAEAAIQTLGGSHDRRQEHLAKLSELFSVVESRYSAMQQDLRERDARIAALEEINTDLMGALRTLTDRIQESTAALDAGDSSLESAIARSEALVSEAFGTGGNANPTLPPDTPPHSTDDPGPGANGDTP